MNNLNIKNSNLSDIFSEKILVFYEVNEDLLYLAIKELSYQEYRSFRNDFISESVNKGMVVDTEEAKSKYWERIIKSIKKKYTFAVPLSYSSDAIRKRN